MDETTRQILTLRAEDFLNRACQTKKKAEYIECLSLALVNLEALNSEACSKVRDLKKQAERHKGRLTKPFYYKIQILTI